MKCIVLILLILFISDESFSQSRASRCYYGSCILDFDAIPFNIISTSAVQSNESAASICTTDGSFLFYSNGGQSQNLASIGGVWDANGTFMENGFPFDSAGCLSSFFGASIIPFPSLLKNEMMMFYLFTKDCVESSFSFPNYNAGLSAAVIDMSVNGGLGTVVSKYQTVVPYEVVNIHSTNYEPLAIIGHANDIDFWLFSYTKDSLYRLPITQSGIGSPTMLFAGSGIILFSPARNYMVMNDKLYQFNSPDGSLTFEAQFSSSTNKAAFSSDGTKLYRIESNNQLVQYDCNAINIISSRVVIDNSIPLSVNQIFLTANSRIFICGSGTDYLTAQITCPNNIGADCGYDPTDLYLGGGITGGNSFTNIPANWLYQQTGNCYLDIKESYSNSSYFSIIQEKNLLQLKTLNDNDWNVNLFNAIGQKITSFTFQTTYDLPLNGFNTGIYYLTIENSNGNKEVRKIWIHSLL